MTLGNHAFDQREALVFIERAAAARAPGQLAQAARRAAAPRWSRRRPARASWSIKVMGRVFMDALDDPFAALERELDACPLGARPPMPCIVDVHAEATSEKQALGHLVDGRASLVVGTHTHVPTADHQILRGGTGLHVRCRHVRRL